MADQIEACAEVATAIAAAKAAKGRGERISPR